MRPEPGMERGIAYLHSRPGRLAQNRFHIRISMKCFSGLHFTGRFMGAGGTKLFSSRPWRSKGAIHSASRTSDFLPGRLRMWLAFTTQICSRYSEDSSSVSKIGFHYTPVLSIATEKQSFLESHKVKRFNSGLVVPKFSLIISGSRPSPRRMHASIKSRCTSSPQQQYIKAFMVTSNNNE